MIEATGTVTRPVGETFPAEYLSRLVVNTFRFSRGTEDSHEPLLAYMAINYAAQIQTADQELAQRLTVQAALRMFASPFHPSYVRGERLSDDAEKPVAAAYAMLNDYIANPHRKSICAPAVLLPALIKADTRWRPSIPGPKGRDEAYKPATYASNVVRFVILGELTEIDEVDAMLKSAGSALDTGVRGDDYILQRSLRLSLPLIIREHLEFHDDRQAINKKLKTKAYLKQIGGETAY